MKEKYILFRSDWGQAKVDRNAFGEIFKLRREQLSKFCGLFEDDFQYHFLRQIFLDKEYYCSRREKIDRNTIRIFS